MTVNSLSLNLESAIDFIKKTLATDYEIHLSRTQGLSTSVRLSKTQSLQKYLDTSIGITIYLGQKSGYASGSDLSMMGLSKLVNSALSIAKHTENDPYSGLAPKDRLAWKIPKLNLYHPMMPSIEQMIDATSACEAVALAQTGINNSDGAELACLHSDDYYTNSTGLILNCLSSNHSLSCSVIAGQNDDMHTAYDYHTSLDWQGLTSVEIIGKQAADNAVEKLGTRTITSRICPIIFTAKVASGFFGHLLSALSGGNQYQKTTFLPNTLDKKIAPDWLNIIEDPLQVATLGSRTYDEDGVLKHKQSFIKNGVVKNYVMGQYSANQLKLPTTGNAGGLSNCYVSSTADIGLDKLIKTMDKGVVITELMGQGVNITTGNYSRGASGFLVENGQKQYPISGITIAGNLKEMMSKIITIGSDIDTRKKIKVGSTLIESMTISGQ